MSYHINFSIDIYCCGSNCFILGKFVLKKDVGFIVSVLCIFEWRLKDEGIEESL